MKKRHRDDTSNSSSSSEDDDSETSSERRHRKRKDRRRKDGGSKREKERKRDRREEKRRKRRERKDRERDKRRRKSRKSRDYDSDSGSDSESRSENDDGDIQSRGVKPEDVIKEMMAEFPNVGPDLKQLLQMIDDGQAVCINGILERSLSKYLRKLFVSLNLEEREDGLFLPRVNSASTLEAVGPLIENYIQPKEKQLDDLSFKSSVAECNQNSDENNKPVPPPSDDVPGPKKRTIGPEMPSAELLAAAAKLTEAQTELREPELEEDTELFIGPPPPAMVAEAETANEAERFEEVTRIMGVEGDSPYDVVGVNHKMSPENIKKRYWKLSLLVHPDKCSHPQAHQAFIKLNKAFKELQDPDKRKLLDDQIKLKEEQEAFKVELKAMREAAQWRKSQGISMEGDEELLAEIEVKVAPKRDEWMTTLPPERRPGGVTMQSTKFSKGTKEGRGDTSAWTDTPADRAQKAKMNYLEAYNEAAALASNEEEKKKSSADADLVDKYNKAKRSKSLVEKHHEESIKRSKKKSKQQQEKEKEEWSGKHPWKAWDRETDLVAGRKSVKLDTDNMVQGLSSRFSSGNFQRNFL